MATATTRVASVHHRIGCAGTAAAVLKMTSCSVVDVVGLDVADRQLSSVIQTFRGASFGAAELFAQTKGDGARAPKL